MQLNIKNPETYELVTRLSRLTGTSMTAAVTSAVRAELTRVERGRTREERYASIRAIQAEVREAYAAAGKAMPTSEEMDAEMYDEFGLPR